jgi:hypothetical protein
MKYSPHPLLSRWGDINAVETGGFDRVGDEARSAGIVTPLKALAKHI